MVIGDGLSELGFTGYEDMQDFKQSGVGMRRSLLRESIGFQLHLMKKHGKLIGVR